LEHAELPIAGSEINLKSVMRSTVLFSMLQLYTCMLELAVLSLCRIAEICWNEVANNPILNPGFSETTGKKREGGGGGGG